MSIFRNLANAFVPVRERREASGTLGALNAELVIPLNGDESALVYIQSTAFIGTLEFTGASDVAATQFFTVAAYPYAIGCAGGTIPLAGQALVSDALVAANTARVYAIPVGQLKALRVRVSAYTSGSCVCTIVSDTQASLNTAIASKPSTLLVTATGAAAAAVTATLPAVTGLRHVIDFIRVTRSATVLLTASATPLVVTTTNLPGSPALTFGADAAAVGQDKEFVLDFGASGLAATALGTATTVVCPVATGSIWRVNVGYRLGL
jgi:tRNA A37 threonylcarbamoyladenosine synthetase subunit TsaC/SUA5/YrdC